MGDVTYPAWLLLRHEMARSRDEDVRPVALLVHNSEEVAIVVCERRLWLLRKALDAAESGVLQSICQIGVLGKKDAVPTWMTTSLAKWLTTESSLPE